MPDDTPHTTPDTPLDMTITTGAAPVNPAGEWVTVSEAVARTGKAERTVRRWVDEGLLESKRQAGRLLIWMAATGAVPATDVIPDVPNETREIALIERQEAMLARLSEQQASLAERQAAPLQATIQEQAEEIGRLKEIERQAQRQAEEIQRLAAELEALKRRSWWSRLWSRD